MKYAIVAEFDIIPGCEAELEQILRDTARWALAEEPRCLRFEVIKPTDEKGNPTPFRLMTNELFEGFEGIEEHRASPRTPPRIVAIRKLVASQTRIIHALVLE
jgi:quinol monooxygenase YgiN